MSHTIKDIVIGLDSSTQSTKAIAWTRDGEALAEGRAPIDAASPQPGWVEQDITQWWGSACSALQELSQQVDPARFAGLAISNQRETVAFLDTDGAASYPAIVWLDERAKEEMPLLVEEFGGDRLHAITGKPVDITPVVYRLGWMRRNRPQALANSAKILDVHGFLSGQLTGRQVASWTSADPFGLLDIESRQWSAPVLDYLGLTADRLADLEPPGAKVGEITQSAARATALPIGIPVFAAGGDGQCAGLGVNAVAPGTIYLNLGTAVITGTWSPTPAIGHAWRTMTSPTGEGYFLEGCQRAGAFFINWFVDNFAGGRDDSAVFERLETQAASVPLGSEGVTVCPYLSGCMDPHWDPNARAAFLGLAPSHGLGHLYRASLEALALESTRCIDAMRAQGIAAEQLLAVGGGANSALWTRMLADASGLPLTKSDSLEASALGAGMSAAVGAGWFDDFASAATAMSRSGARIEPDVSTRVAWGELSTRQSQAYIQR